MHKSIKTPEAAPLNQTTILYMLYKGGTKKDFHEL